MIRKHGGAQSYVVPVALDFSLQGKNGNRGSDGGRRYRINHFAQPPTQEADEATADKAAAAKH